MSPHPIETLKIRIGDEIRDKDCPTRPSESRITPRSEPCVALSSVRSWMSCRGTLY